MKKTYTLNFILGLFLTVFAYTVQAQDDCPPQDFPDYYFWGTEPGQGDFSNGFGDWTTNVLSSDETEDWEIAPDGNPVFTQFFGSNVPMISPTACNGIAHFSFAKHQTVDNPDYAQPYFTYNAELISPIIDCTGKENVTLEFYMSNNPLNAYNRNQPPTYELSVDGGESWLSAQAFPWNEEGVDNRKIVVPASEFDGVSEARIKFTAKGDFYYLSIDDVALFEAQSTDLRVEEAWAAGAVCYSIPVEQVIPMPLMADINNSSALASTSSVMSAEAYKLDAEGVAQKVFETTYNFGEIKGNSPDGWNHVHESLFTPDGVGSYFFQYTIDDENDSNPSNDTVRVGFEVNDQDIFMKVIPPSDVQPEPVDYLSKNRFGGSSVKHAFGTSFFIKDAGNDEFTRTLERVRVGFGPDNDVFTAGKVYLNVYSWVDLDGNGVCNITNEGVDEKTLLGTDDMNITPNTDPAATADMYFNPETEEGEVIKLEDNTNYIALLILDAFEGNYYDILYADARYRQFFDRPVEFAYDTLGMPMINGTMAAVGDDVESLLASELFNVSWGTAFVNPYLGKKPTSTRDINKDLGVKVYPTLAQEVINVELALNEVSETVLVELTSMDGRSVLNQSYRNLQSDKVKLDVTAVAAGSYLVTIRTEEGMISKKVNIIK